MEKEGESRYRWLHDECSHFYTLQKYSLSMRNGAASTWAKRKLPFFFFFDLHPGVPRLPSEVMNMVQIRGRGLSIS